MQAYKPVIPSLVFRVARWLQDNMWVYGNKAKNYFLHKIFCSSYVFWLNMRLFPFSVLLNRFRYTEKTNKTVWFKWSELHVQSEIRICTKDSLFAWSH